MIVHSFISTNKISLFSTMFKIFYDLTKLISLTPLYLNPIKFFKMSQIQAEFFSYICFTCFICRKYPVVYLFQSLIKMLPFSKANLLLEKHIGFSRSKYIVGFLLMQIFLAKDLHLILCGEKRINNEVFTSEDAPTTSLLGYIYP